MEFNAINLTSDTPKKSIGLFSETVAVVGESNGGERVKRNKRFIVVRWYLEPPSDVSSSGGERPSRLQKTAGVGVPWTGQSRWTSASAWARTSRAGAAAFHVGGIRTVRWAKAVVEPTEFSTSHTYRPLSDACTRSIRSPVRLQTPPRENSVSNNSVKLGKTRFHSLEPDGRSVKTAKESSTSSLITRMIYNFKDVLVFLKHQIAYNWFGIPNWVYPIDSSVGRAVDSSHHEHYFQGSFW